MKTNNICFDHQLLICLYLSKIGKLGNPNGWNQVEMILYSNLFGFLNEPKCGFMSLKLSKIL